MSMNRRQRGFTLIELIIFIVVVSAGLAGILSVMNTVVKSSADPMVRKQAMALADSILEEILLKSYAHDPAAAVGTSRSTYDNVSDYNSLTQTAFTDLPTGLSGYAISIAVVPAALNGVTMKKVTVTVSRGGESVSMSAYRADY
jgi:MSHA pilin protein MshD